jgi:hypothetical protein
MITSTWKGSCNVQRGKKNQCNLKEIKYYVRNKDGNLKREIKIGLP